MFESAIYTCCICLSLFAGYSTAESEHRTKAASEKLSDLYCYRCDNIAHGNRCLDLKENTTAIHAKCQNDHRICTVQTITMTSTDMTGPPLLWLLQRNCTKICEPVCVTIGERTKLRSCTTCCETSFCNSGNGAKAVGTYSNDPRILLIALLVALATFSFERDKFLK